MIQSHELIKKLTDTGMEENDARVLIEVLVILLNDTIKGQLQAFGWRITGTIMAAFFLFVVVHPLVVHYLKGISG